MVASALAIRSLDVEIAVLRCVSMVDEELAFFVEVVDAGLVVMVWSLAVRLAGWREVIVCERRTRKMSWRKLVFRTILATYVSICMYECMFYVCM